MSCSMSRVDVDPLRSLQDGYSGEIVDLVRRKASSRSGPKNAVVAESPLADEVGAKRRAA